MEREQLPAAFISNMEKLLGAECPEFLAAFSAPRRNGLRINRRKITPEAFERTAPFPAERIPWTSNGYYVDYRDMPARHPWYRAGVYYLQEPSAMAPAEILAPQPGDRVLDLCAAPGGKATELGARLDAGNPEPWAGLPSAVPGTEADPGRSGSDEDAPGGQQGHAGHTGLKALQPPGLLCANEISSSRARALLHNLEAFGITNALVTCETPARLAERFPGYFDKVLVDAPCSGEGMFRKDPDAARAWYPDKSAECAKIQREIILHAADMLRPGGTMVYSTCTFEPEEDELVILHLLEQRPEMELIGIPEERGREYLDPAFPAEYLEQRGYPVGSTDVDLTKAARIWPHRADGEGHFIAYLRRRQDHERQGSSPLLAGQDFRYACPDPAALSPCDGGRWDRGSVYREDGGSTYREGSRPRRDNGRKGNRKKTSRQDAQGGMTREERALTDAFLSSYLPEGAIDPDRVEVHNGKVYLSPEGLPDIRGLTYLRCGLYLGELRKNRFEPSQALAMALPAGREGPGRISFDPSDERTAQYLRGESVTVTEEEACGRAGQADSGKRGQADGGKRGQADSGKRGRADGGKRGQADSGANGWRLVCVDGYPLGWGKLTGSQLKNRLLPGWRC